MSKNEFLSECLARAIDPAIALENESLKQALLNRDHALVITILDREF